MTDFLSSLVERALGSMPVLERRRPSIFEPSAGMVPRALSLSDPYELESEPETVFEKESSERERVASNPDSTALKADVESIRPASPAAARQNERPSVEERISITQAKQSGRDERKREQDESHAPTEGERRIKETSGEEIASRSPARKESADAESFTVAPLRVTETIVEREVETIRFLEPSERAVTQENQTRREAQPASSPTSNPVVVQSASAVKSGEKRASSLREQGLESGISIEPRRAARKELLRPVAAQSVPQPVQSQPLVSNAPVAEPTVQVTIGRIEVKATQQPAGTRAAARPAPPRLSLEDYLKARGGGNR